MADNQGAANQAAQQAAAGNQAPPANVAAQANVAPNVAAQANVAAQQNQVQAFISPWEDDIDLSTKSGKILWNEGITPLE